LVNGQVWIDRRQELPKMVATANVQVPTDRLEALCRKWQVRELSLFGSALRHDFGPESDVDFLVSFADDAPWSLWDLTAMRDELATLVGRPVDLVEQEGLRNPFRRHTILKTRKVIYGGRER
jgi:predicted nucleotidyltransferase